MGLPHSAGQHACAHRVVGPRACTSVTRCQVRGLVGAHLRAAATKLLAEFPAVGPQIIEGLLVSLMEQGVLISCLQTPGHGC